MQVILSDIRSIQNVATIFRTADGIGVSKIWLSGFTPGPLDKYGIVIPKFKRISLDAEETVDWEKCENPIGLINGLKDMGKFVIGVETGDKAVDYNDLSLEAGFEEVVLIMGSETDGLSDEVMNLCDVIMEMPMNGKKVSLNVGIAFAVAGFVVRDFLLNR